MTRVYLYDDARARAFEPFASSRPISEMVAGTSLIRERWHSFLQVDEAFYLAGDCHADFDEPGAIAGSGVIPAGSIVANSRCVVGLVADRAKAARRAASSSMWRCGDALAAVRIKEPIDVSAFADGSLSLESLHAGTGAITDAPGRWLDEVWDFIRFLPEQLTDDILSAAHGHTPSTPQHATMLGDQPVFMAGDALLEPHVVLDTTAGPILIASGAHVRAFTRITGPCYIGRGTTVVGGDITGCSIGDTCKVRGELSSSVMLGHANKGHDGFVGHSYLGRWVNLGAGTTTSNLKNTYGPVALWTPAGIRNTGMQFLGTMFGDHVKTGIGLRLTTGTVLGAGANVYDQMPPKAVAPYSWGGSAPYDTYHITKFLEAAAKMMSRRHVELTDRARRHLTSCHASRWTAELEQTDP